MRQIPASRHISPSDSRLYEIASSSGLSVKRTSVNSNHFLGMSLTGMALKTSLTRSVDPFDGYKRPCDALGKGLSSWRHGQRTRFSPTIVATLRWSPNLTESTKHWPRLNGPELIANVVTVPNSSMGKESTQQAGYLLIATSDVPHEPVAELAPSALGPHETDQPRQ